MSKFLLKKVIEKIFECRSKKSMWNEFLRQNVISNEFYGQNLISSQFSCQNIISSQFSYQNIVSR